MASNGMGSCLVDLVGGLSDLSGLSPPEESQLDLGEILHHTVTNIRVTYIYIYIYICICIYIYIYIYITQPVTLQKDTLGLILEYQKTI